MCAMGIGEAGTNLLGAALGLAGKKPVVPRAPNVDIAGAQNRAISANFLRLPDLANLTEAVNKLSVDELLKSMETFMPGYSKLIAEGTKQVGSLLSGQVPEDVMQQIQRLSAEKAAGGGYQGSQVARNLTARDLGLTSLDLISKGIGAAESWMSMARAATPMFDFTKMFITPSMQIQGEQWNEAMRFNQNWMANKISAMPSPLEQAELGALNSFGAMVDQYGGMALGGMGGGVGAAFGGGGGAGMFGGMAGGGSSSGPPKGWTGYVSNPEPAGIMY